MGRLGMTVAAGPNEHGPGCHHCAASPVASVAMAHCRRPTRWGCGAQASPETGEIVVECPLGAHAKLRDRLEHALAALRFISRTAVLLPVTNFRAGADLAGLVNFVRGAAHDTPTAFAPAEDYRDDG